MSSSTAREQQHERERLAIHHERGAASLRVKHDIERVVRLLRGQDDLEQVPESVIRNAIETLTNALGCANRRDAMRLAHDALVRIHNVE